MALYLFIQFQYGHISVAFFNNYMIKLEIFVQPGSEKFLEFSQTLEFIENDLAKQCSSLSINRDKSFSIIATFSSAEQLTKVFSSKELGVLSGAIRTLSTKSEIFIHGIGNIMKGTDLQEIRLIFSKREK